jgi:hypothetical protein
MFEIGIRFVWRVFFSERPEVGESALEHAALTGFVAVHDGELGAGGESGEAVGDALDGDSGLEAGGGLIHHLGLDGPAAVLAPVGGGHFLDERQFDAVGGLKVLDVRAEEGGEGFGVLAVEDDGLGKEAMADGVHGRALFSLGGDGSVGAGSVGPRGIDSSLRGHHSYLQFGDYSRDLAWVGRIPCKCL